MKARIKLIACAAVLAAAGGIAVAAKSEAAIRATGVPTSAQCDEGACYVGVGEYALRVPVAQGELGALLLAEAEEARRQGRSMTYRGFVETGPDGFPAVRSGRTVLVSAR